MLEGEILGGFVGEASARDWTPPVGFRNKSFQYPGEQNAKSKSACVNKINMCRARTADLANPQMLVGGLCRLLCLVLPEREPERADIRLLP